MEVPFLTLRTITDIVCTFSFAKGPESAYEGGCTALV